MNKKLLIPLALFVVLFAFLLVGLGLNPREVPSPLVGKPAPEFRLAKLHTPEQQLGTADLRGQVYLLNVWASWCVGCREEHGWLLEYARSGVVPIYGLNYKDKEADAVAWLEELGDPYVLSAVDSDGRVAIDYGVYGAPETYLIDQNGTIRYKEVGPLSPDVWSKKVLPLIQELNRQGTTK